MRATFPAVSPQVASPRFEQGIAALGRGAVARARRAFVASIDAGEPAAPWAVKQLLMSHLVRGEREAAERAASALRPPAASDLALGMLERDRSRATQARPLLERAARDVLHGRAAQIELAYLLCRQGEAGRGRRMLARADAAFVLAGDRWGEASAAGLRGAEALHGQRLETARRHLARAARLKTGLGDGLTAGLTLYNLGSVYLLLADFRRAFAALRRALVLQERAGDRAYVVYTLSALGNCAYDLAAFDEARRAFRLALTRARRDRRAGLEASALVNLALLERLAGDGARAVAMADRALARARQVQDPAFAVSVATFAAQVQAEAGRPARALALLAHAARVDRGEEPRVSLLLRRERARALLALGRARPAVALLEEALARAAPAQGMVLDRTLTRVLLGRARLEAGDAVTAADDARRAQGQIEHLLARTAGAADRIGLLEAYADAHATRIRCLLRREGAWDGALAAFAVASALKSRELGRTFDRAPAAATGGGRGLLERVERRLAGQLGPGAALVEFHVGTDATRAFVVREGALVCREVQRSAAWIAARVARVLEPLRAAGSELDLGAALGTDGRSHAAHDLARALLGPLRRDLEGVNRVAIVPHGPLHALPFGLLPLGDAEGGNTPRYLAERVEIAYWLRSFDAGLPPPGTTRSARPRTGSALVLAFSPTPGTASPSPFGPTLLGPIGAAEREADVVAAALQRAGLAVTRAATADELWEGLAAAEVVHVAVHAVPDPDEPQASALVVSGSHGPELVRAAEVRRSRVRAQLVFLAACSSGTGRLRTHEGESGLVRAFLEAGAGAVIASAWAVEDRAARRLAEAFYRRYLAGAMPARALALAARGLVRGRSRHPFFWAPFRLFQR